LEKCLGAAQSWQVGLKVSLVGLGCNNFAGRIDFDATRRVVHKALDLGITLFDNADTYGERGGAEEYLGKILGPRRKEIVLATKFGRPMDAAGKLQGASRRYIMDAVEASLRRLQTDYIDLYWQHIEDPLTPIEETLRALDDLVRHGKVRYIACSTLASWQVVEARMDGESASTSNISSPARSATACWSANTSRTWRRWSRLTGWGSSRFRRSPTGS
jgi:aryl-alcohol dehydrogenase-like predicted oxidoreductase